MKTRKNAVVELICWKSGRAEKLCLVGIPIKEDAKYFAVYSTHGNQGWTDKTLIKKSSIVERHELDVIEGK